MSQCIKKMWLDNFFMYTFMRLCINKIIQSHSIIKTHLKCNWIIFFMKLHKFVATQVCLYSTQGKLRRWCTPLAHRSHRWRTWQTPKIRISHASDRWRSDRATQSGVELERHLAVYVRMTRDSKLLKASTTTTVRVCVLRKLWYSR